MNEQGHAQPTISRRRLAVGAAWSVPAVAMATAAPAFAASACGDCFELDWSQIPSSTYYWRTSGTTFTMPLTYRGSGTPRCSAPTLSITLSWTGAVYNSQGSGQGHGSLSNMARGQNLPAVRIPYLSKGLVLNQQGGSVSTLSYSLSGTPVRSLSTSLYDLSRINSQYGDYVKFNVPVTVTGSGAGVMDNLSPAASSGTLELPAGTEMTRPAQQGTSALPGYQNISATSDAGISNFTMTYRNDQSGWQFVALGNLVVCT